MSKKDKIKPDASHRKLVKIITKLKAVLTEDPSLIPGTRQALEKVFDEYDMQVMVGPMEHP